VARLFAAFPAAQHGESIRTRPLHVRLGSVSVVCVTARLPCHASPTSRLCFCICAQGRIPHCCHTPIDTVRKGCGCGCGYYLPVPPYSYIVMSGSVRVNRRYISYTGQIRYDPLDAPVGDTFRHESHDFTHKSKTRIYPAYKLRLLFLCFKLLDTTYNDSNSYRKNICNFFLLKWKEHHPSLRNPTSSLPSSSRHPHCPRVSHRHFP
jgi:hypothetical protein